MSIDALWIVRLNAFPANLAEAITAQLSRRIVAPCRLLPATNHSEIPIIPGRNGQADAEALLRNLEREPAPPGVCQVAITTQDLGVPIFTFVFGLARLHSHAALVSTSRLTQEFYGMPPDPILTIRRVVDEILHEVGHLAGLIHCPDYRCIMHFAASVEKVDLRESIFCPDCRQLLPPGLRSKFHRGR